MKKLCVITISMMVATIINAQVDPNKQSMPMLDTFPLRNNNADSAFKSNRNRNNNDTATFDKRALRDNMYKSGTRAWNADTIGSSSTNKWQDKNDSNYMSGSASNMDTNPPSMQDSSKYLTTEPLVADASSMAKSETFKKGKPNRSKDSTMTTGKGSMKDRSLRSAGKGSTKDKSLNSAGSSKKVSDRITMKNDKVFIVKNGKDLPVVKTTVVNGMTIMTDGTLKMADGTKTKLKNGQYIEVAKQLPAKSKSSSMYAPKKKA